MGSSEPMLLRKSIGTEKLLPEQHGYLLSNGISDSLSDNTQSRMMAPCESSHLPQFDAKLT